jgi:hypothetical protein
MKKTLILALIGAVSFAHADFITNGDFESHPAYQNGSWGLYSNTGKHKSSVPGWYSENKNIPIELGTPSTYGVLGDSSNSLLELDSTQNSAISQRIHKDKGMLELTFDYAMRAGTSPATNNFEVLWNHKVVATVDPISTTMTTISPIMVMGHGHDTLTFEAIGASDSYGGEIDNVHLNSASQAVPEPVSLSLLGIGAAGLLRRKRS